MSIEDNSAVDDIGKEWRRISAGRDDVVARWAVFTVWLCVVSTLAAYHAPWRDEVRALSFALGGDDPVAMMRRIGDGHPALWFLMLRGAYAMIPTTLVLPGVAMIIAVATMLLVVMRAPWRWWQVAMFAASQFMLFDYAVIARNYGISVLLMLALAALPDRWRRGGALPGVLLALLANTNVHSLVFVTGYLVFMLTGVISLPRWWRTAAFRAWIGTATIAAIGILICLLSVYPPLNTAAREDMPPLSIAAIVVNMLLPALQFGDLTTEAITVPFGVRLPITALTYQMLALAMSALLMASACGVARSRGAVVTALSALIALNAMFLLIYPGSYRHQALWLVFVLSLDWMVGRRGDGSEAVRGQRIGRRALLLLLALQIPAGIATAIRATETSVPYSRSADLAKLIAADVTLGRAIVMSEPDYLVESLPYYLDNPLYLPRERRFGRTAQFGDGARLDYPLGTMLDDAARLRAVTGRPVLLLLQRRVEDAGELPPRPARRRFDVTPESRARLIACTRLLVRFGPAVSGETFGVFLLPETPLPACRQYPITS